MYIEVEHDKDGNIVGHIRCDDCLPQNHNEPMFWREAGLPPDMEQSRIYLDTLTAMEIEHNSGQKAVINESGQPEIVCIDRTDYIRQNFKVDMTQEIPIPAGMKFPAKLKMRKLIKKL